MRLACRQAALRPRDAPGWARVAVASSSSSNTSSNGGSRVHSPALRTRPPTRGVASRAGKDDPSWGEIAEEAKGLAKSVFNKIKDVAGSLVKAPKAEEPRKPATREPPPGVALGPAGGLLPNLLGRAVGGLLSSAISAIGSQLEAAAREQAGAYEEASARLQASEKLRARLGTVTVGPVMSQSSASSSINGVVSKQVSLVLPVYGSTGSGTAQVNVVEGPQQARSMTITVRTNDGGVVVVDDDGGRGGGGSGGARGNVIDVEWRDVKK